MASDWLAAGLRAYQVWKSWLTNTNFYIDYILVIQAPQSVHNDKIKGNLQQTSIFDIYIYYTT